MAEPGPAISAPDHVPEGQLNDYCLIQCLD